MNLKEARTFLGVTVSKSRYSAREIRNLPFTIDIDYIMDLLIRQNGKCAMTGWDLEFTRGGDWDGKNPRGATMDRINNSKGYVKGNIQLVCGMPNVVRGSLSMEQIVDLSKAIVKKCK
jgi:hypothetical protein